MHGIYTRGRVDDVELDAKSQWLSRGKTAALSYLDNLAIQINKLTCCNGRPRYVVFQFDIVSTRRLELWSQERIM